LPYYGEAGLRTRVVIAQGATSTSRSLHSVNLRFPARALHYMGVWSKVQTDLPEGGRLAQEHRHSLSLLRSGARLGSQGSCVARSASYSISTTPSTRVRRSPAFSRYCAVALRRGMRTAKTVSKRFIASNRRNVEAVHRLLPDPELRACFGAAARETALREYSLQNLFNRTKSLYHR
jgi:hypothetical protein